MFNMSDLSIELQSTKTSYTFPIKDTSLDWILLNLLDMILRQNWVWKVIFLLPALNLKISFH